LSPTFVLAEHPGGSSGTTSYRAIADLEQFDYRSQVGVAPGAPEGSIFFGFENRIRAAFRTRCTAADSVPKFVEKQQG
jgi:hypothetical protein